MMQTQPIEIRGKFIGDIIDQYHSDWMKIRQKTLALGVYVPDLKSYVESRFAEHKIQLGEGKHIGKLYLPSLIFESEEEISLFLLKIENKG